MKHGVSKILMVAAAVVLSAGISIVAHGATAEIGQTVTLTAGKAETIALPGAAADILVANPSIADVGSLRADRLYVVGRGVGDTNILAFDAEGKQMADIAVHVSVDDDTLRKTLKELFPKERVEIKTVNNSVVLKGTVSTPMVANQVRDLAQRFIGAAATNRTLVDIMTVRGEQQVMLKVKVLEVRRDVLREMGINLNLASQDISTAAGFGISGTQFGSGVLELLQRGSFGPLSIEAEGLETHGVLSTLAEPTLTAISGESAGFLAGGEFPIPASRDAQGNVTLEFRQFGVSLSFIPTVLGEENISLQLTSEVSERSDADGVTLQGTLIPGLSVRRAQTTVQMASGGTIMIAGLLRSTSTEGLNGLPGFKDLPILGELFKSKSFRRGESELVFLVTPYLVEPFADQQAERVTRNDNDLLHSILQTGKNGAPVTAPATMPGKGGLKQGDAPVSPQPVRQERTYPRQGEENRTAGEKKADASDVWRPRSVRERQTASAGAPKGQFYDDGTPALIGAPVGDVEQAPFMAADHPALTLPVDGKLALNDDNGLPEAATITPLPRRKPVMGGDKQAKLAPVKLSAIEPAAGEQTKAAPAAGGEKAVEAKSKLAAVTVPLPRRKPVTLTAAPALSNTFMNSLKKTYGNRVAAKLGEGQSYGYIVD